MDKLTLATIILTRPQIRIPEELLEDVRRHSDEVIVIDRDVAGDFAEKRNFGLEQSKSDWTLFLDTDERCPPALWKEIRNFMDAGHVDALVLHRHDWFLGRRLRHGEVGAVRLLRCARTKAGKGRWERPVHEVWNIPGAKIAECVTPLEHHPHPTLNEFLRKLHWYASLEPKSRRRYSFRRIVIEFLCFPPLKFIQNFIWRLGFLDGWQGFLHAGLMSYYSLITRVFLYEAYFTQKP